MSTQVPWADGLAALPERAADEQARWAHNYASIVSYQHPDHDTAEWPLAGNEQ